MTDDHGPTTNDQLVLYEDDRLMVIDKPAGMVVHPTYKNKAGTLLDWVQSRGVARPSIVGRLDRLTSGLVVVAKDAAAHAALQRALAAPETVKEYLAIVHGRVEPPSGRIDLRIRVDPQDRRRVVTSVECGAASTTLFERVRVLANGTGGELTLLKCRPLTGRRHQIRAHLAASGWPILGDATYGPAADNPLPRHALHAWRLRFRNPFLQQLGFEPIVFLEAALYDNFGPLLTLLSYKVI